MTKVTSKRSKNQEFRPKDKYRVTNWSSYNRSLKGRGDITLWFDKELAKVWLYDGPDQRGAQYKYSDECILGLLQLKVVFHLKYRQLEGFVESLLKLMDIALEVPSYSQICRRAKELANTRG